MTVFSRASETLPTIVRPVFDIRGSFLSFIYDDYGLIYDVFCKLARVVLFKKPDAESI